MGRNGRFDHREQIHSIPRADDSATRGIEMDPVILNPNRLRPKPKQAATNKALTKATVCVLISFPERSGDPVSALRTDNT